MGHDSLIEYLAGRADHMLGPEDAAIASDTLARAAALAPQETRAILHLALQGYTHPEIGQHVGLSERAVEGHLYRLRRKIKAAVKRSREGEQNVSRRHYAGSNALVPA